MKFQDIKYIICDIEGTTTSVAFVYDTLFPYFRENFRQLSNMKDQEEVQHLFKSTVHLANKLEEVHLHGEEDILTTLLRWCEEDKKVTPLKTAQGLIWKDGYEKGRIKGHVYPDVPEVFAKWHNQGLKIGIYSSGSIAAQKLLFSFADQGNLSEFLSAFFDTGSGAKRELQSYDNIAKELGVASGNLLFLSDIPEELKAAKAAGWHTCQLLRPGTKAEWDWTVDNFHALEIN